MPDLEYERYELAMQRLDALMGEPIPRVSEEEFDDMRSILDARFGVFA